MEPLSRQLRWAQSSSESRAGGLAGSRSEQGCVWRGHWRAKSPNSLRGSARWPTSLCPARRGQSLREHPAGPLGAGHWGEASCRWPWLPTDGGTPQRPVCPSQREASKHLGPLARTHSPQQPLKCHRGAREWQKEHKIRRPPSRRVLAQPHTSCATYGKPLTLSEPVSSPRVMTRRPALPGPMGPTDGRHRLGKCQPGRAEQPSSSEGRGHEGPSTCSRTESHPGPQARSTRSLLSLSSLPQPTFLFLHRAVMTLQPKNAGPQVVGQGAHWSLLPGRPWGVSGRGHREHAACFWGAEEAGLCPGVDALGKGVICDWAP